MPLELFFDLVFVLASRNAPQLMADDPTWAGLAQGLLVLAVLWWSWVGYAWLTSVVDPEEGIVRLAIFAAMAALLVAAICVPRRSATSRSTFAHRVRGRPRRHIASSCRQPRRPEPAPLRAGLADRHRDRASVCSSPASLPRRRPPRGPSGRSRSLLDMGEPYLFGAEGWKLMPGALRRALRADRDHRPRRVDRRDRRRRRGRARRWGIAAAVPGSRWPRRSGGSTSTSSPWSRPAAGRGAGGASRTRSPATPTPTCTSRWWPGSCWSRWA